MRGRIATAARPDSPTPVESSPSESNLQDGDGPDLPVGPVAAVAEVQTGREGIVIVIAAGIIRDREADRRHQVGGMRQLRVVGHLPREPVTGRGLGGGVFRQDEGEPVDLDLVITRTAVGVAVMHDVEAETDVPGCQARAEIFHRGHARAFECRVAAQVFTAVEGPRRGRTAPLLREGDTEIEPELGGIGTTFDKVAQHGLRHVRATGGSRHDGALVGCLDLCVGRVLGGDRGGRDCQGERKAQRRLVQRHGRTFRVGFAEDPTRKGSTWRFHLRRVSRFRGRWPVCEA